MAVASSGSLASKAEKLDTVSSILGIFDFEPLIIGTVVRTIQVSGLVPWPGSFIYHNSNPADLEMTHVATKTEHHYRLHLSEDPFMHQIDD